jgi:hypothetical protein
MSPNHDWIGLAGSQEPDISFPFLSLEPLRRNRNMVISNQLKDDDHVPSPKTYTWRAQRYEKLAKHSRPPVFNLLLSLEAERRVSEHLFYPCGYSSSHTFSRKELPTREN